MAKAKKKANDDLKTPLNINEIADRAHGSFSTRVRESINRDDVRAVVAELGLAKIGAVEKVPRLMVRRLRFTGSKTIGSLSLPIDYEQSFDTGINVILIENNSVGKSSILKTIKFALTGSDEEYDKDVRGWIHDIWLEFSLDDRCFTMMLSRREDGLHGRLASGQHNCFLDEVSKKAAAKGFYHRGEEEIQQALDSFFIQEFGLGTLGWNVASVNKDGTSKMAWTSWKTYFLALRIPDDNHTYFICKPEAVNQEPLLFSTFLGLNLAEPINQLSMEINSLSKASDYNREQLASQEKRRSELIDRRLQLRQSLDDMNVKQLHGFNPLTDDSIENKLSAARKELAEKTDEYVQIKEQSEMLAMQLRHFRSLARRLREQIVLSRELTGLQISFCPNCAQPIDDEAVHRENTSHQCRLCVKPVLSANGDEEMFLEAEARGHEVQADGISSRLAETNQEVEASKRNIDSLQAQVDLLWSEMSETLFATLPTIEESEQRGRIHEEIGEINFELRALEQQASKFDKGNHETRIKILKKVWEVVKQMADEQNKEIIVQLNELAQEVIVALGAVQITGIKCHSTGIVKLTKNNSDVSFSKIMNPGERYRAKLALFLAMMRLGCEGGRGRHPGFLMLDQLGAAEMVPENLSSLASALNRIDNDFGDQVQIIAFTTRSEFQTATQPSKIYGHQGEIVNGKKYAF